MKEKHNKEKKLPAKLCGKRETSSVYVKKPQENNKCIFLRTRGCSINRGKEFQWGYYDIIPSKFATLHPLCSIAPFLNWNAAVKKAFSAQKTCGTHLLYAGESESFICCFSQILFALFVGKAKSLASPGCSGSLALLC